MHYKYWRVSQNMTRWVGDECMKWVSV